MKNKKLKIFLDIILTLILLVLINIIRNYFIVKKLYETSQNHFINFSNVLYTHESTVPYQPSKLYTTGVIYIDNYYFKDNIVRTNSISNFTEKNYQIVEDTWKDLETNEFISKSTIEEEFSSEHDYTVEINNHLLHKFICQNINKLLRENIFSFITSDSENHYKLRFNEDYLYVNKSTGIIEKNISKDNKLSSECSIKENVVTDEDVAKF